jgi:predicted CXXCH cytochrome family protein
MQRPGLTICYALAAILLLFSLQAMAETPLKGRDFNHDATGFPLNGGHASTACESCHLNGVFQGTPKNCDECHALGKRVLATPKPATHIVTDAPCNTCHFNTYTFLGARFNHGTAIVGQCVTCHNGRQSTGRPSTHSSGLRATASCDSCHRSFTWLPASWNHIGVVPHTCDSSGCHVQGSNQYYKPANHQTTPYLDRNTFYCDECHNYISWVPALFIHDRPSPSGVCMGCHDGSNAPGKSTGHIATTDDCNVCHTSTISWLGALGAMPANHIPFNAGVMCTTCHPTPTTWVTGAALHVNVSTVCKTCHATTAPTYLGNITRVTLGNHQGSTTSQDCVPCHRLSYSSWSN